MEYYTSITELPERKHVMGMSNHFDTIHFPEGQHYKIYSCLEFLKKIIALFKTPELTLINTKE